MKRSNAAGRIGGARGGWTGIGLSALLAATAGATVDAEPFSFELGLSPYRAEDVHYTESPWGQVAPDTFAGGEAVDMELFERALDRIEGFIAESEFTRARTELDLAETTYGEVPPLLYLAAVIEVARGNLEAADRAWGRLAAETLEPKEEYQVLIQWSTTLLRLKEWARAEEVLERVKDLQPYDPRIMFNRVCVDLALNRTQKAQQTVRALMVSDIALLAGWLNQEEDIIRSFLGPDNYVGVGQALLTGGYPVDNGADPIFLDQEGFLTISASTQVEEGYTLPDTVEAVQARMGAVHAYLGRLNELVVEEEWGRVARVGAQPQIDRLQLSAPAYRSLVLYASARNGDEAALTSLQTIVRTHPECLEARLRLALAYDVLGQQAAALAELAEMNRRYPGHVVVALVGASVLAGRTVAESELARPQFEQVEAALQQAIRRMDQYRVDGAMERALQLGKQALDFFPASETIQYRLAQTALLMGRTDEARSYLEELAVAYPGDIDIQNQWGGLLVRAGAWEEAVQVLDDVLAKAPELMSARYNRALAAAGRGRMEQAKAVLDEFSMLEYGQTLAWLAQEAPLLDRLLDPSAVRAVAAHVFFSGAPGNRQVDLATMDTDTLMDTLASTSRAIRAYIDASASGSETEAQRALERARALGARPPGS